jgi:hypothetical protein
MTGLGAPVAAPVVQAAPAGIEAPQQNPKTGFFRYGAASYLFVIGAVLVRALSRSEGKLVYVIDDPAIHLSVARNLAEHGTWGVVPGHFESASSSPLWTIALATWIKLVPGPDSVAPLALNIAAALAAIAVLGAGQRIVQPSWRRPFDVVAVAVLVTIVLFLPGLAMTGMEHSLHIALVLGSVALFHRIATDRPRPGPAWLPYALLALATLTRFETAFVAAGLAVALFVAPREGSSRMAVDDPVSRARRPVLVLASSAIPLAAYATFNHLMGQGWLPNSVLAKAAVGGTSAGGFVWDTLARFNSDPLVGCLAAVAVVALLVNQRRWASWTLPAIVVVATTGLHIALARVGWYERYQAYVIALGVYLVIDLLGSELPAVRLPPAHAIVACGVAVVGLLLAGNKPAATVKANEAVGETYDQRYQAALFFERYYDGRPIATGELGYISLYHDGPLTDVLGLGDHEVLQEWQRSDGWPTAEYWDDLAQRRGVEVVAVYPNTLGGRVPDSWIQVGKWDLDRWVTTVPSDQFQFYATTPEGVGPLRDHLVEFEDELPGGVTTSLNEFAELQAAQRLDAADDDGQAAPTGG